MNDDFYLLQIINTTIVKEKEKNIDTNFDENLEQIYKKSEKYGTSH